MSAVHPLKYEFTVEDPTIFALAWRAEMAFVATDAPIYEFACHASNYAMTNVLAGARAVERAQAPASRRIRSREGLVPAPGQSFEISRRARRSRRSA